MNPIAWWFCYAREKCDKYSELPSFYLLVMLFKFNKIFILTYFQIIDVWMPEKPGKLSQLSDGSYHINILSWLPDGCYSNCQMAVTPALRMLVSRLSDGCYPGSQMAIILALRWLLSWLSDGCYPGSQIAVILALRWLLSWLSDGCYPDSQMAVIPVILTIK